MTVANNSMTMGIPSLRRTLGMEGKKKHDFRTENDQPVQKNILCLGKYSNIACGKSYSATTKN